MKPIKLLFLCFASLLFFYKSVAQGKTEGLPITVMVNTSVNLNNGAVEISGTSASMDNDPGQVIIEIVTPAGNTDKLSTRADKQTSKYLVKYTPKALGKYTVTAFASDKVQSANTTFTVAASIAITETFTAFDKAKTTALKAVETGVTAAAASVAPADEVAKAKQKLNKLKQSISQFDKNWADLKTSINTLQQLAKKHPEINEVAAPDLGKLCSQLNQSSDILKQVQKDLATSKSSGGDECNTLYKVSESCAAFSTGMNLVSGGILAISESIFIDKVWPKIAQKIAPKVFDANDNFVFKQAGKAALTARKGIAELKTNSFGAGVMGDLTQYVSDNLFKKYCTEYKGPVKGNYTVEFKNKGKTYMRYKLTYEGKISVYARKDKLKSASIPQLSGYLEGNITNVDFTDDVWAVEKKSDWDEIKYQRVPAPAFPFNTSENDTSFGFGAAARAALPGAFYFPLEAKMVQEKMVIKLMPALSDLTDEYANSTIVVARAKQKPHNISGAVFKYPISNAQFILTRTMRMPENSPTVTLDIKTKNGTSTLQKDFTRTESPNGDTKVDFNLNLKMSND
jgi:hypothetical protein